MRYPDKKPPGAFVDVTLPPTSPAPARITVIAVHSYRVDPVEVYSLAGFKAACETREALWLAAEDVVYALGRGEVPIRIEPGIHSAREEGDPHFTVARLPYMPPETITTAAIRACRPAGRGRSEPEVWTLPRPARHHILAKAWSDAHFRNGKPAPLYDHDSGFMTSTGRFVDREEAEAIARASGQIEGDLYGGVLTSEDLW